MSGLAKICKLYGRMVATNEQGERVVWVYDYAQDKPVHESEMPHGSDRHLASERARFNKQFKGE